MTPQKLKAVKEMVALLESQTGKKVNLVRKTKVIKEYFDSSKESDLNGIVQYCGILTSMVNKYVPNVSAAKKFNSYISAINKLATEGDEIQEDVSMSVDAALKDIDAVKKLHDKEIDITITDGDDKLSF